MTLQAKQIVVGIGGGIGAFKAIEVVRELGRRGASVRVAMTAAAQRFVGATTFTGLTGTPAVTDLWDDRYPGEVHVELTEWADAALIVPATHNLLARLCAGIADDPVLALLSCSRGPNFLAPAMHTRMWESKANQRNVTTLTADGFQFIGPVAGPLASGQSGMGRLQEPHIIVDEVALKLTPRAPDLLGRTVLITAGPTQEELDPVRYISNRSTGRMGYAVAVAALARGARVLLVSGPTQLPPPAGAELIPVRSAQQMYEAVMARLTEVDAMVMTAAVADYRPAARAEQKIKKQGEQLTIELVKNPDILQEVGRQRRGKQPVLVGFAMETHDVARFARGKLQAKRADLIVGNEATVGFGGDDNVAVLVDEQGDEPLERMSKLDLGHRIWDRVVAALS